MFAIFSDTSKNHTAAEALQSGFATREEAETELRRWMDDLFDYDEDYSDTHESELYVDAVLPVCKFCGVVFDTPLGAKFTGQPEVMHMSCAVERMKQAGRYGVTQR